LRDPATAQFKAVAAAVEAGDPMMLSILLRRLGRRSASDLLLRAAAHERQVADVYGQALQRRPLRPTLARAVVRRRRTWRYRRRPQGSGGGRRGLRDTTLVFGSPAARTAMAVGDGVVSPRALDPAFKSGAGRVGASLQGDEEDGCGKDEAVKDRGRRNVHRWGLWQGDSRRAGIGRCRCRRYPARTWPRLPLVFDRDVVTLHG
jgi:hypothetical protein